MTESMAQIRNLSQRSANMKPVLPSAKKKKNKQTVLERPNINSSPKEGDTKPLSKAGRHTTSAKG